MFSTKRSSEFLDRAIRREVSGEKVLWIGHPNTSTVLRKSLLIWLVGIPWSALTFTLFGTLVLSVFFSPPASRAIPMWEYTAMSAALIFVGAFAMVGVGLLGAPFWAAWRAGRSAHVITDKRLITLTVGHKTEIKSVHPGQLLGFERQQYPDGSGSLTIITGYVKDSEGETVAANEQLVGVPDVAKVEKLLRELQANRSI